MAVKYLVRLIAAGTVPLIVGACGREAEVVVAARSLTISKHSDVALTPAKADAIYGAASNALKTDDDAADADDIVCDMKFTRNGDIAAFADAAIPSSITSAAELASVFNEPSGYIKIVKSVGFCKTPGSYAGCARLGQGTMVMETSTTADGLVLAHEYGHTASQSHRGTGRELMTGEPLATDQNFVNDAECTAIQGGPTAVSSNPGTPIPSTATANATAADVDSLIGRLIVDRMPIEEYSALSARAVPRLNSILGNGSRTRDWPNAMIALGLNADEKTIRPLVGLLGNGASFAKLPLKARVSGMFALGYFLNRMPSNDVQKLLERRAGTPLKHAPGEDQIAFGDRRATSRAAQWALALSGRANALASIRGMAAVDGAFLQELERANAAVRTAGLVRYYGDEDAR